MSRKGRGKRFHLGGKVRRQGINYVSLADWTMKGLRRKHAGKTGGLELDGVMDLPKVNYRTSPTTGEKRPVKPKPKRGGS